MSAIFLRLSQAFLTNNVRLFALTLLFALPLGLVIAFGSMSRFRPLAWLIRIVVWIVRGTPLMLQILAIYMGPGLVGMAFGWPRGYSGRIIAAVVTFSINYACYFSEIYRGGIQSIPQGQYEAGQVLGMTKMQIFFRVALLQLIKRIVPPMGNEIITLVKDTALANYISVLEIIITAKEYTSSGLIWPLFATALYFLAFVGVLTLLLSWFERKLDYFK